MRYDEETAFRSRLPSWRFRLGVGTLILVSAIFSFLNAGERVTVDLGLIRFLRISLVGLVFVVFLLGMLTMFLVGLQQDRRVRAALRARGLHQPAPVPSSPTHISPVSEEPM